jgi:hypothetical protein
VRGGSELLVLPSGCGDIDGCCFGAIICRGAQSAQMIDKKDKVRRVQCSQNCGWFLCCWGRSKRSWDIMVEFDFWSCGRE